MKYGITRKTFHGQDLPVDAEESMLYFYPYKNEVSE